MKKIQNGQWPFIKFGMLQFGSAFSEILIRLHLLLFYTDRVLLSPSYAAIAIAIGVVWDAINDPIIGRLADVVRQRRGSAYSLMIIGMFMLSGGMFFLFTPPDLPGTSDKFLYLTIIYLITNTGMSLLTIPYASEGGNLFRKSSQAANAFGWRLVFGNLGTVTASLALALFLGHSAFRGFGFSDYSAVAIICAISIPLFSLPFISEIARNGRKSQRIEMTIDDKFFSAIKNILKDHGFMVLFAAFFVATIGQSINAALAMYYYKYRLALNDAQTQMIIGIFLVVFTLSVVGWVTVSKRYDKRILLGVSTLILGILTCVSYPFMPDASVLAPLMMGVGGGILVGSILLFDLLVLDLVATSKEDNSHQKRSYGLYFGFMKMGEKISRAIAISGVGFFLEAIGFSGGQATAEQAERIGNVFGFVVGLFFISGALILLGAVYFSGIQRTKNFPIEDSIDEPA